MSTSNFCFWNKKKVSEFISRSHVVKKKKEEKCVRLNNEKIIFLLLFFFFIPSFFSSSPSKSLSPQLFVSWCPSPVSSLLPSSEKTTHSVKCQSIWIRERWAWRWRPYTATTAAAATWSGRSRYRRQTNIPTTNRYATAAGVHAMVVPRHHTIP